MHDAKSIGIDVRKQLQKAGYGNYHIRLLKYTADCS
mgnify:CR=1 FL=1